MALSAKNTRWAAPYKWRKIVMMIIRKNNYSAYSAMQKIINVYLDIFYSWSIVSLCSRMTARVASQFDRTVKLLRRAEQGSSFCGAFCYGWCYRQHGAFPPVAPVAFSLPARTQARPGMAAGRMGIGRRDHVVRLGGT
jgi:hypothetical protein